MKLLNRILGKKPVADSKFEEGLHFLEMQCFEAAVQCFDEVLAANSKVLLAYVYKAQCLIESSEIGEAKQCLFRAIKQLPNESAPYFYLGSIEMKGQNYQEAIVHYKTAVKYLKSEAFKDVLYYNLGKSILEEIEDEDADYEFETLEVMKNEALKYFELALEETPSHYQANFEVGNLYFYYLSSHATAKVYFEKTLRSLSETNAPQHYRVNSLRCLAICEAVLGDFITALKYVEASLQLEPLSVYAYSGDVYLDEVKRQHPTFEKELTSLLKTYET